MIDEKALNVAIDKFLPDGWREHAEDFGDITDEIRGAIEAYEAALWRPIDEAPRDGSTVLIAQRSEGGFIYNAAYHLVLQGVDWWIGSGWKSNLEGLAGIGAMFRTITPPPSS